MKKSMLATAILIALFFTTGTKAQVGIGISNSAMNASAQLEVSSSTRGFLPPRMTETQRNSISSPAAGLTLWCSNCGSAGEMQVFNGTAWTNLVGGAAAAPLEIGQSYQGGKIAYIDGTGLHGLIAATSDQSTGLAWWNGSFTNTSAPGTAIGTGMENTNAVILAQGNTGSYAAKICRDYQGGGYTDWFLPSKDELNKLFVNKAAIGVFANFYYWSSTETDTNTAWNQDFSSGFQGANYKNGGLYVRAVRAF